MPYYEKKIISGNFVEIEQFFSSGKKIPRSERLEETPLSQAKQNEKQSEKELLRKLHCNFDPARGDMYITLTFSEAVTQAEAAKAFRNFELKAKRLCKKNKTEYKRLSTIEKQGQWHIHMVVSGLPSDLKVIQSLWVYGRAKPYLLDKSQNYKDLVKYLLKHEKPSKTNPDIDNTKPPRKKHEKRWSGTRNLKKPIVTITQIKRESIMRKTPTAPKGYTLLPDWELSSDNYGHFVRRYAYIKIPGNPPQKKKSGGKRHKPPTSK